MGIFPNQVDPKSAMAFKVSDMRGLTILGTWTEPMKRIKAPRGCS